jgi:hypothetical protein
MVTNKIAILETCLLQAKYKGISEKYKGKYAVEDFLLSFIA